MFRTSDGKFAIISLSVLDFYRGILVFLAEVSDSLSSSSNSILIFAVVFTFAWYWVAFCVCSFLNYNSC